LLFVVIFLFFYTISQVTKIGVGSFAGSGEIEIALPGGGSETLLCRWGGGTGFYSGIIAFLLIISASIYKNKESIPNFRRCPKIISILENNDK